jgi:hypothetical protein
VSTSHVCTHRLPLATAILLSTAVGNTFRISVKYPVSRICALTKVSDSHKCLSIMMVTVVFVSRVVGPIRVSIKQDANPGVLAACIRSSPSFLERNSPGLMHLLLKIQPGLAGPLGGYLQDVCVCSSTYCPWYFPNMFDVRHRDSLFLQQHYQISMRLLNSHMWE